MRAIFMLKGALVVFLAMAAAWLRHGVGKGVRLPARGAQPGLPHPPRPPHPVPPPSGVPQGSSTGDDDNASLIL